MSESVKDVIKDGAAEMETRANESEENLSKQLVLLNSGALAILFVDADKLVQLEKVLMTITVSLIGVSLLSILVRYTQAYLMYEKNRIRFAETRELIRNLDDKATLEVVRQSLIPKIFSSGGIVAYWISIVSFMLAATLIGVVVILRLW